MKNLRVRTMALLACFLLAWAACGDDADDGGAGGTGGSDIGTGGSGGKGGGGSGDGGSGGGGDGGSDGGGAATSCSEAIPGFVPCGGDPTGSWAVELFCVTAADEFTDECPETTVEVDFPENARFIFEDGTVETVGVGATTMRITAPLSCIGADECEAASAFFDGSCTGTEEACSCELVGEGFVEDGEVSYRVDGNQMTFADDEGESVYEYCVQGSTMTLRHLPEDDEDDEGILVLKRK